jgi:diguanylate cyclase (GGDEF)-like protein
MDILQNLVHMTGQRDHLRLEFSVLSTLLQLPDVTQVRALEIHPFEGLFWVRPRTWLENGQLVSSEYDFLHDPQREPLSTLPHLKDGLERKLTQIKHQTDAGTHTLWLPVWMNEQARVCIELTQSAPVTEHSMDILLAIFQVYRNYQSLLDYSERDALTGLLNRKTFDEHLLRLSSSCSKHPDRPTQPWLAVIDIDHFKQVNDRHGHLVGDQVLVEVAATLRGQLREYDLVGRFGGEEFVVLLPHTDPGEARQVAERLRRRVGRMSVPVEEGMVRVTVSTGVAFGGVHGDDLLTLLAAADLALYQAKALGRDRVCLPAPRRPGPAEMTHADEHRRGRGEHHGRTAARSHGPAMASQDRLKGC